MYIPGTPSNKIKLMAHFGKAPYIRTLLQEIIVNMLSSNSLSNTNYLEQPFSWKTILSETCLDKSQTEFMVFTFAITSESRFGTHMYIHT